MKKLSKIIGFIFLSITFGLFSQDTDQEYLNQQLWQAVEQEDCQRVELLLNQNADPNDLGHFGETVLIKAVLEENLNVVSLLLKHRADTNIWSNLYCCALTQAIIKDNIKIIKLLLEYGAFPDEIICAQARDENNLEIINLFEVINQVENNENIDGIDFHSFFEQNAELQELILKRLINTNRLDLIENLLGLGDRKILNLLNNIKSLFGPELKVRLNKLLNEKLASDKFYDVWIETKN